jgi:CHRD domain
MRSLMTIVAGVALLAAVGLGATVAGDGDSASAHDYGGKQGGKGKKWRQYKDLETSQAALSAYLTGKAEVNDEGDDGAGDPDAKGTASFLVADERTLCYGFAIEGAEPPDAVHIHRAPAGENGDIVIEFANPPKDAAGQPAGDPGASSGCKVLEAESEVAALRRILSKPKGYYVNIHTSSFPDGAVRGQLTRMLYDND